ncbi:MAG: hypothetical protein HY905_23360 [Deltaproteobacteria bacterium]|nr:hypothetical protein [Deltaproteobacteria bacterium]
MAVAAVLPVGKVESAELKNGSGKTESGAGEWTDAGIYDGCYASCRANYNKICLPAVNAASDGRIPEERHDT